MIFLYDWNENNTILIKKSSLDISMCLKNSQKIVLSPLLSPFTISVLHINKDKVFTL